ncbi:hypothetical protein pb186bvf_006270 [Paramecium bursaria]
MNTAAIIYMIFNCLILIGYFVIKRRIKQITLNLPYSQEKKQFWERVIQDQELKTGSVIIQTEQSQIDIAPPSPSKLTQYWFIEKFFQRYAFVNFSHLTRQCAVFKPLNESVYWQALFIPLLVYQLCGFVGHLSYSYITFVLLLIISIMNIFLQKQRQKDQSNFESMMNYTCQKLTLLNEIFPRIQTDSYSNLNQQIEAFTAYKDKGWVHGGVILSFLLTLNVRNIDIVYCFTFIYGMAIEQGIRVVFAYLYSKRLMKEYILEAQMLSYPQMSEYALYLGLKPQSNSPKKYMLQKDNTVTCFNQSNHLLIHESTQEALHVKTNALRITSANLGTIEDTKLDMTEDFQKRDTPLDSNNPNAQEQDQTLPLKDQLIQNIPQEQFKKKPLRRLKLESLYNSKQKSNYASVVGQSPNENQPPPLFYSSNKRKSPSPNLFNQFNPIQQVLQQLSPIRSMLPRSNNTSQREQFPNQDDQVIQFQEDTISNYKAISPRLDIFQAISPRQGNSNGNSIGIRAKPDKLSLNNSNHSKRRNNSYKTSKEEEQNSYKDSKKIRVSSLNKKSPPQNEKQRRKSTNTKVRGESLQVKRKLQNEIPVLNFDSERFRNNRSPYLEYLPNMVEQQQQRTHRKQNSTSQKKGIKQMLQIYENTQTSNENRKN